MSSMGFAHASGFSPSSFTFNLVPDEEGCEIITVDSDSPTITISNMWAENKDIEWKISLFDKDANYHGISIDYDEELSINEREVEVCVSGSKLGEYHGVILLREEQEGNSIIQMGVWLKLVITEETQEAQTQTTQEVINQNTGGGGGGGGSLTKNTTNSTTTQETQEGTDTSASAENNSVIESTGKNKITGLVTGEGGTRNIIIAILFIIIITGIVIYNANIRRKKKNGY